MKEVEPRVTPKKVFKAVLWTSVILATGLAGKKAAEFVDSLVNPTYIVTTPSRRTDR